MVFSILLACAPDPADLACREGFTRAADGQCYPPYDVDVDLELSEALEELPCGRLREGGQIDLEAGCVEGFCEGDLFSTAQLVLGSGEICTLSSGDQYCEWPNGMGGRWDDDDGVPGPDPLARNQRVHLSPPYIGATTSGLGVWVQTGCFVRELGPPDVATLVHTDDGVFVEALDYDAHGLLAYDFRDMAGVTGPDEVIDDLYLYGAP